MAYNMTPRCASLLKSLAAADFYALDLKLYLDTHPDDCEAIKIYREAVKQADACRHAFEAECYPLRCASAGKEGEWDWLCGQWIL